jgi:hypothetical protein
MQREHEAEEGAPSSVLYVPAAHSWQPEEDGRAWDVE